MKITKTQLKQIIKEEINRALDEAQLESSLEQEALAMLLARHGQQLSADPERRQATIDMMLDIIRTMGAEKAIAQMNQNIPDEPDYDDIDTRAHLKTGQY